MLRVAAVSVYVSVVGGDVVVLGLQVMRLNWCPW